MTISITREKQKRILERIKEMRISELLFLTQRLNTFSKVSKEINRKQMRTSIT